MKLADGRYDRYQRMLQGWLDEVYDKGYKQGIQDAGENRDIRDIAIQGYIGTMMCNGYTVTEIEKVLKDMKEI